MSSQLPPDPYFNDINFNPSFFIDNDPFLTEAMANFLYLRLTGGNITGNLGIGTGAPLTKLHIVEPTGTAPSTNGGTSGTIIIDHDNSGGASSILFRSAIARGIDYGYIQYQDAETVGGVGEAAKLIIGTQNDNVDDILLLPSGNVGIGTTDAKSRLTLNAVPTQVSTNGAILSLSPMIITNTTPTSTSVINDPRPVLHLCRDGTGGQAFAARATFNLCRYENSGANSRTRLDISLANDAFNDVNLFSIRSDGRVGIGTTDPGHLLDLYNGVSGANSPFIRLRGGGGSNNEVGIILNPAFNRTGAVATKIVAIDDGGASANLAFFTAATGTANEAVERMRIKTDGNVGISTDNPSCRLSLGSSVGYKVLSLWDGGQTNNFQFVGFGNNGGLCFNTNNNTTDAFQFRAGINSSSASELMRISGTGNLSLGTTDTATYKMRIRGANSTILRIETDTNAASQTSGIDFGTPDVIAANSAGITSTRLADNKNDIQFYTSDGAASTLKLSISPNDVAISTPCNTIGANYFTDGQYFVVETRINTAAQSKTGYFLPLAKFFNSLVLTSVSHTSPNYTYWHGYFGTNNSTEVMYISTFSQLNMTIEAFVEQTSNAKFLYMRPSIGYNGSAQIRVKHYG